MTDHPEEDDIRLRLIDVYRFAAAVLLMTRGRLTKPPEGARIPYSLWARKHADPAELKAAIREVRAMTPEQRGDFLRPFAGDFDA